MELMFGQDRMDYQLVMKRNFTPQSKFADEPILVKTIVSLWAISVVADMFEMVKLEVEPIPPARPSII
jgi:hypothetical protein